MIMQLRSIAAAFVPDFDMITLAHTVGKVILDCTICLTLLYMRRPTSDTVPHEDPVIVSVGVPVDLSRFKWIFGRQIAACTVVDTK